MSSMNETTLLKDCGDHVLVEFGGLTIVIGRSSLDGALSIDIDSADCALTDVHPGHEVPRIRLSINDYVEQLNEDGSWVPSEPFLPNILDHLAAVILGVDSGLSGPADDLGHQPVDVGLPL